MIDRQSALRDLDRLSLKELTATEIENKYEMKVMALVLLTEWKVIPQQHDIPTTVKLNTDPNIVIDVSTKEGQQELANQAVKAIIELLSPLNHDKQRRVIESVAAYFEVYTLGT